MFTKKLFVGILMLVAFASLAMGNDEAPEATQTETEAAVPKEVKNGFGEHLIDLGIVAGKTVKKGAREAGPIIKNMRQTLRGKLAKIANDVRNRAEVKKGVEVVENNEQVKKGLKFFNEVHQNRVKPFVDGAAKKIKPVVDNGVNMAKPHIEKINNKIQEQSQKLISEHEQRQALLRKQTGETDNQ